LDELGFPGFETTIWFCLFAQSGAPNPVIDGLSRETVQMMRQPEVLKKHRRGRRGTRQYARRFAAAIKAEAPHWARVITEAGRVSDTVRLRRRLKKLRSLRDSVRSA